VAQPGKGIGAVSKVLSPTEAIGMIPGWRGYKVSISKFSGGLSNRNYLVTRGADEFFLRLDAVLPGALELDRKVELIALQNASEAGLAPELVFADPSQGILLCRRLRGRSLDRASLDDTDRLAAIGELLCKVHELPLTGVRFEAREAAEMYVGGLQSHPQMHAFALRCEEVIDEVAVAVNIRCCHNDLVAANIIETPGLKLIDWEYACDNDPLFDLASLIGYHDLTDQQARHLLRAYAGSEDGLDRLRAQCRLFDAVQWLWLANRQLSNYTAASALRLADLQQRIS